MAIRGSQSSASLLGDIALVGVVVVLAVAIAVGAFTFQHGVGALEEVALRFLAQAFGG